MPGRLKESHTNAGACDVYRLIFLDLDRNVFERPEFAKVLLGWLPNQVLQTRATHCLRRSHGVS